MRIRRLVLLLLAATATEVALADASLDEYISVLPVYHIPPGNAGPSLWRYATSDPGPGWNLPGFDDSSWPEGQAGFGEGPLPGDHVGTSWTTSDIYVRRWLDLTQTQIADLAMYGRYDDTVEVFINGVSAYSHFSWSSKYRFMGIYPDARNVIQPGPNLVAVHGHDYGGGRYLDLGFCRNPLKDMPLTGSATTPAVSAFADAVRQFMIDNVIPAGVLAVMKRDEIVATHGFGYRERTLDTPVPPDAVLRLASNDKVVTRGIVRFLVDNGFADPLTGTPIELETLVFPLLEAHGLVTPSGPVTDSWIAEVTIQHLLEFKSGIYELPWVYDLAADWDLSVDDITEWHNAGWIASRRPQFQPGTEEQYNSAGFFLLRMIADVVTGDVEAFLQDVVLGSAFTEDIFVSHESAAGRHPDELWYATNENSYPRWIYLDEYFALGSTAEAFVRYLRRYHMTLGTLLEDPSTGEWAPVPDNGGGVWYGAMAGTWSVSIQRRYDEVGIVLILNQVDVYDEITDTLSTIADGIPDDECGWSGEGCAIFADGFESGNVSMWSETVP